MKAAFDTSLLRSLPLEKALQEVSDAGYSNIEIGLAHFNLVESTNEEVKSLLDYLSRFKLTLAAVIGNYPLSYPDEEVRTFGVAQYIKAIESCEKLGCRLFASELNGDIEDRKGSEIAFLKSFEEIRPNLEKSNVTLCFEAHPGDFVESNKLAVDLIRKINSPHLKYLYCAPHSFILGQNVREMIEYSRDVLSYVHYSDSLRPQKTFFSGRYVPKVQPHQHLLPGLGDVDMKGIIDALHGINYEGYVTLNPFSHFDRPIETLRESRKLAEPILS
jgi:myo-inositol catabolism protein IolH